MLLALVRVITTMSKSKVKNINNNSFKKRLLDTIFFKKNWTLSKGKLLNFLFSKSNLSFSPFKHKNSHVFFKKNKKKRIIRTDNYIKFSKSRYNNIVLFFYTEKYLYNPRSYW